MIYSCLLVTVCFNYKSTMKIDEEGGGTLDLEIDMPFSEAYEIEFTDYMDKLDSIEGWHTSYMKLDTLDSMVIFHLQGNFTSIEPTQLLFEADSFSLSIKRNGKARTFFLYRMYAPVEKEIFALKDDDYDKDNYTWCERLIGPGRIVKHNADKVIADTLIWERRIIDVFENGLSIEATWESED